MQRIKLMDVLMAALAVVAISSVGASMASAAVFTLTATACSGGTNVALCYETAGKEKLELTGEQTVVFEGGTVEWAFNTTPGQTIQCNNSIGAETIAQKEPLGAGAKTTFKGTITYKECKLTSPEAIAKKCAIQVEDTTKELQGTLETESTLVFKPASGTTFIEFDYTNIGTEICPATFLGKHDVTGTDTVEILNPGTPEETKKIRYTGFSLTFLSSSAALFTEETMVFTGLGDKVYVSKVA